MPVDQTEVLDSIGIDRETGEVVLMISDHLEWGDERHFQLLEEKIGNYLNFSKSNELEKKMPNSVGRPVRIDIVHLFKPNDNAEIFLNAAKSQLNDYSIGLSWYPLPSGY